MANQMKRSTRKRTLKSEETAPVAKRQKRVRSEQSVINDGAEGPITDICNELIDKIFKFLDITSLLKVAGTCTRFQMAAAAIVEQRMGNKFIRFIQDTQKPDLITVGRFEIDIVGLRYSLPFLRCFGANIKRMKVINADQKATRGDNHLERYINQYCADTLSNLCFKNRVFSVHNFTKPFKKV